MFAISTLVLALLSASAHAIDGGHRVAESDPISQSLVQVVLWDDNRTDGSTCTGTLIAKDLVVTAAHCVFADPDAYLESGKSSLADPKVHLYVYRGNLEHGWTNGDDAQNLFGRGIGWMPVKSVHVAPTFAYDTDGPNLNSDIALLQVDSAAAGVPFTVAPVLTNQLPFHYGQLVRVVGAGPKDKNDVRGFTRVFRTLAAYLTSPLDPSTRTQNLLFVSDDGEDSACTTRYIGLDFGDSGGPAFVTVNDREYLWGVDSQGATYTVLPLLRDWLNQTAAGVGSPARF